MDILDIILAKSLTPQGQIDTYAAKAQKAVVDAKKAVDDIESITEQTNTNNENAQIALENAQAAAATFEDIDATLDAKVQAAVSAIEPEGVSEVDVIDSNTSAAKIKKLRARKKGVQQAYDVMKNYTSTGSNEDGGMTQKAITQAINNIKPNLGTSNKGKMTKIANDGSITYSSISENDILDILNGNTPVITNPILGVIIDYENKTVERCEDAVNLTAGTDFNVFSMYGGRKRCNVDANGAITAWYGDSNYVDDGSNGDVMVYQPKFYYKRTINKYAVNDIGKIVRKETLLISEKPQTGFKLHPRFKTESGDTLEYVLLSAYEGSTFDVSENAYNRNNTNVDLINDYLVSCATSRPITNVTIINAEQLAVNKGSIWHITDMGVESINQMLFIVEYATLNGQDAIGAGISKASTIANTGLTSILGNMTGEAPSTATTGNRAISYRGYENWWGNTWCFIGGINILGDNNTKLGIPYIATNFNYDPQNLTGYNSLNFNIAKQSSWVSAMGYGNEEYDWVYLPAECSGANSALPVGDNFWTMTNFTTPSVVGIGGTWSFDTNDGPFYYGCDRGYDYSSTSYNARLMCIPTENITYNTNYQKWLTKMGG